MCTVKYAPLASTAVNWSQSSSPAASNGAKPLTPALANRASTVPNRDLRSRRPDARVRTLHLDCDEARALPGGRVDAPAVRTPLPVPDVGLKMTVLHA